MIFLAPKLKIIKIHAVTRCFYKANILQNSNYDSRWPLFNKTSHTMDIVEKYLNWQQ